MKILVTGGAGFIGSHVADVYLKAGHQVLVLDNLSGGKRSQVPAQARFVKMDIRDRSGIQSLFHREKFDIVNNHAAQMSVPDSVKDPIFDAEVNVLGLLNLLEAGKDQGLKKFIHVSSGGTVYGIPKKLPAKESFPILPMSPYGITKAVGEDYLRFYAAQYGIHTTVLRYSNVYGPRQQPHGEAGVVSIFIQRMLKGEIPTIFGDGSVIRDFVYVGDVAEANLLALKKGDGEAFNIGTCKPTSMKELYKLIAAETGVTKGPNYAPSRVGDLKANWLSFAKAKEGLGWTPRISMKVGLKKTSDYFRAEVPTGRLIASKLR